MIAAGAGHHGSSTRVLRPSSYPLPIIATHAHAKYIPSAVAPAHGIVPVLSIRNVGQEVPLFEVPPPLTQRFLLFRFRLGRCQKSCDRGRRRTAAGVMCPFVSPKTQLCRTSAAGLRARSRSSAVTLGLALALLLYATTSQARQPSLWSSPCVSSPYCYRGNRGK
jgi:hypothetical protein